MEAGGGGEAPLGVDAGSEVIVNGQDTVILWLAAIMLVVAAAVLAIAAIAPRVRKAVWPKDPDA